MKRFFAIACLLFFLTMVGRFILGGAETAAFGQLSTIDKFIIVVGVAGAFGFWFSMLADFFTNKDMKHKVAWGFSLVFLSWLASLFYFAIHFLPRTSNKSA